MSKENSHKEVLDLIPEQGFIKVTGIKPVNLKKEDKIILIRKGNELFNKGKYDLAKKIFLTTGYTDGLIRLGNYYYKNNQPLEAFRMFWLAPYKKGIDNLMSKFVRIINSWLNEDKQEDLEKGI
ncbi:MAG: hypothetical protein JXB88_19545 [Spirochaetales bacterium]|nr:hypothetical protein [Spirochaetales bacterium]